MTACWPYDSNCRPANYSPSLPLLPSSLFSFPPSSAVQRVLPHQILNHGRLEGSNGEEASGSGSGLHHEEVSGSRFCSPETVLPSSTLLVGEERQSDLRPSEWSSVLTLVNHPKSRNMNIKILLRIAVLFADDQSCNSVSIVWVHVCTLIFFSKVCVLC